MLGLGTRERSLASAGHTATGHGSRSRDSGVPGGGRDSGDARRSDRPTTRPYLSRVALRFLQNLTAFIGFSFCGFQHLRCTTGASHVIMHVMMSTQLSTVNKLPYSKARQQKTAKASSGQRKRAVEQHKSVECAAADSVYPLRRPCLSHCQRLRAARHSGATLSAQPPRRGA